MFTLTRALDGVRAHYPEKIWHNMGLAQTLGIYNIRITAILYDFMENELCQLLIQSTNDPAARERKCLLF